MNRNARKITERMRETQKYAATVMAIATSHDLESIKVGEDNSEFLEISSEFLQIFRFLEIFRILAAPELRQDNRECNPSMHSWIRRVGLFEEL